MTPTIKLLAVVAFVALVYVGWIVLAGWLDRRSRNTDGEGGAGP